MAQHRRKPGRPPMKGSSPDAREALVLAASGLFAQRGTEAVSVREVAEAAGVTSAMIHYYFKDKRGLMRAVLERGLDRILEIITEVADNHEGPMVTTFIDRYIHAINAEPSLPQLMVREVLSGHPDYRDVITERFARRAVTLMPPRLAEDIASGHIRSDLDPRFMMLSLVGMCVFPYIAGPLLQPVLGFEYDEAFADALVAHTSKLFNEGAVPGK